MNNKLEQLRRDNHYVPIWYQSGFIEPGQEQLRYLDMRPKEIGLKNGNVKYHKSLFWSYPKQCFYKTDLYSTFFGTSVNDEIEDRLFGKIDNDGVNAVKAYINDDESGWHHHFQTFFTYIDIQKLRTPKGLAWLAAQYPNLSQNQLMWEMQAIRGINCTPWAEGVREIVSAEEADIKFIVSDNPVTVYNYAVTPDGKPGSHDPAVSLKSSQTIYPLNRDFCLILTNLEYAEDPSVSPLKKRVFARNYRNSMVSTIDFIRKRKLSDHGVLAINHILKSQASRYIAAGKEEWLFPERHIEAKWQEVGKILRPPDEELHHFGGEIYAKFDDGHVHYQDRYGRTEKQRDFLKKTVDEKRLKPASYCGCGQGGKYENCCKSKRAELRPSWAEISIRERNLAHFNYTMDILGFEEGKSWEDIRNEITDEKISKCYSWFEGLWPLDSEILDLLPKPDGRARALYTGMLHPEAIDEFAIGSALYFDEILIENPMMHPGAVRKEFNPVEYPKQYRIDFIQNLLFLVKVMPLVELGKINLFPDPCWFDKHLRQEMMEMAKERSAVTRYDIDHDPRLKRIINEDMKRSMLSLSPEDLKSMMDRIGSDNSDVKLNEISPILAQMRKQDPLAIVQEDTFSRREKSGQMMMMKHSPNFEMSMFLAQATGSAIVTDSPHRWQDLVKASYREPHFDGEPLSAFLRQFSNSSFAFPQYASEIAQKEVAEATAIYPAMFSQIFRYLTQLPKRGKKPNWEAHVAGAYSSKHETAQKKLKNTGIYLGGGKMSCLMPSGGIWHTNASRLLLMSGAEHHLPYVPMAFFLRSSDK